MHPYSDILGPVDSAFYYVERPETPMNIGALTIFDGEIDFDDLLVQIEARLHRIPRYRDRVVQAPLNLGQPTWVADPYFFIGNHVMQTRIEPPGTEAQLRTLAGKLLSRTLDRDKPLWELYVIDGLAGQTAMFFKVHHCMVDGLAAVELFTFMMDTRPDAPPEPMINKPMYDPYELPDPVQLTRDSLMRDVSHQFGLLKKLGRETLRLGRTLTDRERRLKMMVAAAHLVSNNLKPIKKLPINGKNSGDQSLVWAEFPLESIHAIRKPSGASVNEVMLTLLTRAVERYTDDRGGSTQPFLRILVPFNMRDESEKGEYGNRISVLPVDAAFGIADPQDHLKAVMQFSKVMKDSSLAYSMDLLLTLPSLLPAPAHLPVWNMAPMAFSLLAHLWCTNVAAMPIPVYMLGHELKHVYGYFPLNPSMGLACVIVSYNGRITMTLMADRGIVDDASSLEQYLKDAYAELYATVRPKEAPQPVAVEAVAVATNGAVKHNGGSTEHVKFALADAPADLEVEQEPVATMTRTVHRLFSDGWAKAMHDVINDSDDYRNASTRWAAGSLAFVMEADAAHGFDAPAAVWFDLHRGVCRSSKAMSAAQALREAAYVIQGNYAAWMDVLSGKSAPLMMLTRGRLKLKKGALLGLLPHTRSAAELVRCAQRVPWE